MQYAPTEIPAFGVPILQRAPVEMLNRNFFQIHSVEAANVDRGHAVTLWVDAFAVRMNAARGTKAMFDDVLIERVGGDVPFRGEHTELIARHKPQKRSLAGTDRTIAGHCSVEVAFDLKRNLAAVTTAGILHEGSP